MNKKILGSAIALAVSAGMSTSAHATMAADAVLAFDDGAKVCAIGPDTTTETGCAYDVTSTTGSYFSMDADGSGSVSEAEKTPISLDGGVQLGVVQETSGESHSGAPTGSENTTIDNAWNFFTNTGMHNTVSAVTVVSDDGAGNVELDFSGWRVDWNGIEDINMGGDSANFASDTGIAIVSCGVDCSVGDTFVLDYAAHVPLGDASGFGGVPYALHMEGTIAASPIPVPAAVWLFGSGLIGLAGVARRRKTA